MYASVCAYDCVYAPELCTEVSICVLVHVYAYVYTCELGMSLYVYICINTCELCMQVSVFVNVFMHVCACELYIQACFVFICVYINMYAYMCT